MDACGGMKKMLDGTSSLDAAFYAYIRYFEDRIFWGVMSKFGKCDIANVTPKNW